MEALEQNGSNSAASWVAGKIVVLNEMIPGQQRSDDAARLYLRMMIKMASEVGQERFNAAIEKAIETCEYRRPTIATMRRLCGIASVEPTEVALAWALVTKIVTRHTRYNENGSVILVPRHKREGNDVREEPVPEVAPNIARAVSLLGGWAALVDAHPIYWNQRFTTFKELFWQDEPVK